MVLKIYGLLHKVFVLLFSMWLSTMRCSRVASHLCCFHLFWIYDLFQLTFLYISCVMKQKLTCIKKKSILENQQDQCWKGCYFGCRPCIWYVDIFGTSHMSSLLFWMHTCIIYFQWHRMAEFDIFLTDMLIYWNMEL